MRLCGALAALALASCSSLPLPGFGERPDDPQAAEAEEGGSVLFSRGYGSGGGYVAADEPEAAKVGRAILERGGSAGDAAAAMGFALTVTYPGAASLGGGGVCLTRSADGATEAIGFPATNPPSGGEIALPGLVRGLGLLQVKHGKLKWSAVVAPAERLALSGFRISRAYAERLDAAPKGAPALARLTASASGEPLREGETQSRTDLAATLALIREGGASALYTGALGRQIVAGAQAAGGTFTLADLEAYAPLAEPAQVIEIGQFEVVALPVRFGAGQLAAAVFPQIPQGRAALDAALASAVPSGLPAGLDEGSVSFVVVDSDRQAVACAFTMSDPFGAGQMAGETGVLLLRSPAKSDRAVANAFLSPVFLVSGQNALRLAAAGSGGPETLARIGEAMSIALEKNKGNTGEIAAAIGEARDSRVNLTWCPANAAQSSNPCTPAADGFGLALSTGK